MSVQRTLVLIKPDGQKRRLTGLVIDRLDATGLEMVGAKITSVTEELARQHYIAHKGQPYYDSIVHYLMGEVHQIPHGRIMAMVYQGENAIAEVRRVTGATNPDNAAPGTIRSSFGRIRNGLMENVIHASSDPNDAEREVKLWFRAEELVG